MSKARLLYCVPVLALQMLSHFPTPSTDSTASSVLLSTVHRRRTLPLSSSVIQTRHEQGRSRPCLFSAKFQRWLFLIAEEKKEREQASGTCEVLQILPNTSRRYNHRSSLKESRYKQASSRHSLCQDLAAAPL